MAWLNLLEMLSFEMLKDSLVSVVGGVLATSKNQGVLVAMRWGLPNVGSALLNTWFEGLEEKIASLLACYCNKPFHEL